MVRIFRKRIVVAFAVVLAMVMMVSCGGMQNLTPKQKYYVTQMTFNDIVEQYIAQAKIQPESVKVNLRKYVNPVIKEARDALKIYKTSIGTSSETSNRDLYIAVLDKLTDLMLKYGITIKEE